MDRYRATERTLKLAATHSCKVNGAIIKDDFVNIATRAASEGVTLKGTKELVKECFLEKATSDTNTLQNGCNLLIDTLALLEGLSNPKTVREDYKSNTKTSLATIAKCAKGCQFKQSDKTVVLCNISDINAFISINGKTDLCSNEHSDGFYNLNILESRRVGETSRVSSVNNNVLETLEAYTGGTKNLSFGQGFTILSEKNIIDNADTSDIIKDDDESFLLKNVNLTQLLPGSQQTVIKSVYNPFEPYYEDLKEVYACSRDNGVTTYVGGMYPPLHTYYTKHTGRKHIISPIVSQNCIRQVWCEQRSTLANSLLKSSKKSKNKLPFAFMVTGQADDNYIDIVFINVSTIRSHSSASLSPVEHVVLIGENSRLYNCVTYVARVHPSAASRQLNMCRSLLTSHIEQGKLFTRILIKLLRCVYALRNGASEWRSHNDTISKAISNIQWGCLWNHWNFYPGDIVTEADMQELPQLLNNWKIDDNDESIKPFNDTCRRFIDDLNNKFKAYKSGKLQVAEFVTDIICTYTNEVIPSFEDIYSKLRNSVYEDLRASSKSFPQMLANILESTDHFSRTANSNLQSAEVINNDLGDLLQMRAEILPKHLSTASEPADLTSVYDILGRNLLENPAFSGAPFLEYFQRNQKIDPNIEKHAITSTVADVYNKCLDGYNKGNITMDKSKTSNALVMLNCLIILLANHERVFIKAKDMKEFLSKVNNIPEALATWALGLFYERNSADEFTLYAKGLQRLICYILWLCIYLVGGKYSYNFATLINADLKSKRMLHSVIYKCLPIAGLDNGGNTKSTIYSIDVPLKHTTQMNNNAIGGVLDAMKVYGKRRRR